jgi:hypothetical protein
MGPQYFRDNFPQVPNMEAGPGLGLGPPSPQPHNPWQNNPHATSNPYGQQQQQMYGEGRQLRTRGRPQSAAGRRREHSPGWSPIGLHVQKRRRMAATRPNRNFTALARFGKPLPPPRLDDYYEGSDFSSGSDSPSYQTRGTGGRFVLYADSSTVISLPQITHELVEQHSFGIGTMPARSISRCMSSCPARSISRSISSHPAVYRQRPAVLSPDRSRRRRQKDEDSDPDYEGEKSERSGGRAGRRAAKRSTASNTGRPAQSAHQHQQQMHQQQPTAAVKQQMLAQRMQASLDSPFHWRPDYLPDSSHLHKDQSRRFA